MNHNHKVSMTKRLLVDAGHRLMKHEGKCRNYHGHSYAFDITCRALELDDVGRIVDFGVVKEKVGGWLDLHMDHGMILQEEDPLADVLTGNAGRLPGVQAQLPTIVTYNADDPAACIAYPSPRLLLVRWPPTAENLARFVYELAKAKLSDNGVWVSKVVCWETPSCWAEYMGDGT